MCVHMCIWVNLRVRAHITVTSLWFVRIACYVIAWGTGSVRAGDETGKFFAQLSLYMAFTFQSWVSMPQATRARRKLRDLLVHLGRKYFVPVWRSTFPPPTAVSDAGVAMATGKVQDTEQSSSCIH